MSKVYPRVGKHSKLPRANGRCLKCNKSRADIRVDIQVNAFIVDDVTVKLHSECLRHLSDDDIIELAKQYGVING